MWCTTSVISKFCGKFLIDCALLGLLLCKDDVFFRQQTNLTSTKKFCLRLLNEQIVVKLFDCDTETEKNLVFYLVFLNLLCRFHRNN